MRERLEHRVRSHGQDRGASPARDVAEGMREKGLPHADGPDDGDVGMGVEKTQRRELVEEGAIEGHLRGGVPRLQDHRGIQPGLLHPEGHAQTIAPGDFITQDEQQEIVRRHLLLAREREPLGERIEDARELEPAQDGFQIGTDAIGRHGASPSGGAARSGSAYW